MTARPVPEAGATDALFGALADPTRRWLLRTLAEEGPLTATDLAGRVAISRQAVAKHLGVLREADLVTAARVGRETRFEAPRELLHEHLAPAAQWIAETTAAWDQRLADLKRHVERRPS